MMNNSFHKSFNKGKSSKSKKKFNHLHNRLQRSYYPEEINKKLEKRTILDKKKHRQHKNKKKKKHLHFYKRYHDVEQEIEQLFGYFYSQIIIKYHHEYQLLPYHHEIEIEEILLNNFPYLPANIIIDYNRNEILKNYKIKWNKVHLSLLNRAWVWGKNVFATISRNGDFLLDHYINVKLPMQRLYIPTYIPTYIPHIIKPFYNDYDHNLIQDY